MKKIPVKPRSEYEWRDILKKHSYSVFLSPASRSPVDVISVKFARIEYKHGEFSNSLECLNTYYVDGWQVKETKKTTFYGLYKGELEDIQKWESEHRILVWLTVKFKGMGSRKVKWVTVKPRNKVDITDPSEKKL